MCKTLHKWCPIIQIDPANFTHVIQKHGRQYPWKTNQTCSNANDRFCPLSFSCRDTCTVDSRVSINTTATTPWGKNCTAGEGYCPLTASCMPIASQCSFKAFYDWKMAGNDSVTPAGQACPAGTSVCIELFLCLIFVTGARHLRFQISCFNRDRLILLLLVVKPMDSQ